MARSRRALVKDDGKAAEIAAIKGFYETRLTAPIVQTEWTWPPVHIGPTWEQRDGHWVLPDRSLGWELLAWTGMYLQDESGDPWVWTDEQARFLLHWYAVDPEGRFVYRDGVLQRLKGFGKDPIGAGIAMFELLGPCVFAGWDHEGQPIGKPHPTPWIQVAAVSLQQTKNTMQLLPTIVTKRCISEYKLQIGKTEASSYGPSGLRTFQAVTSSPSTLQGARSTFVLLNETHEWVKGNDGHEMAYVLANNSTKSKGGGARTLRITNAYEPGQDSVAERDREGYETMIAGKAVNTGLLYDSLEANPKAPLTVDAAPEVVRSVRGDSVWLDIDAVVKNLSDVRKPASQSRRFWYNQIVAAEDAWVTPQQVDIAFEKGKDLDLEDGDEVLLFGDGSKSDDASALVAMRVSDGVAKLLHVDQPTEGRLVSRPAFDQQVAEAFEKYTVVGFWFDPSHAKDNYAAGEDDSYWRPLADEWMERYGAQLKLWPAKGGTDRHAILFDMSKPSNFSVFCDGAGVLRQEFENESVKLCDSKVLKAHLNNARILPTRYGDSVRKESRASKRKIDAGVCLIGARAMLRKFQLEKIGTTPKKGAPGKGRVIVMS